tara:strand:+ start:2588 stop:3298 length:711 start_codon:yes stop_codon:yes gene_type:complete
MVTFRLFLFLVGASTLFAENPYQVISERNAFNLTVENTQPILPPVSTVLGPDFDIFLTGTATRNQVKNAYFALKFKGELDYHYISLKIGEKQKGIELLEVLKDSVFIVNNDSKQYLTFKTNSFPTVVLKVPSVKSPSRSSKSSKSSKSSSKDFRKAAPTPPTPRPQIVTVPSRRPQVDPRIIEKGLDYLSKTDNDEKKEYVLKRLESLQSGQSHIKSDIDRNERRRQYDERKKRNN